MVIIWYSYADVSDFDFTLVTSLLRSQAPFLVGFTNGVPSPKALTSNEY